MRHSDPLPKITVEDLLRLKRSERPAPEFWTNFESELRQKQLTALLEKRSWWQELPQFLARRAYLPVGATAILAFTLVSVKYSTSAQQAPGDVAPLSGSAVTVSHPVAAPSPGPEASSVTSPLVNRSVEPVLHREGAAVVTAALLAAPAPASSADTPTAPAAMVESPSSRYIATNLDRLERTDPDLVRAVMGSRLSAPARVQTASLAYDELASVPTNTARRSRLLAQYSERPLNPEPTAPEIVRERLARRLGDTEITDRISRIGLKGDQVSLGFTLRL